MSELADAVRAEAHRAASHAEGVIRLGTVTNTDPLEVELLDTDLTLDEDDLDFGSWAQVYMDNATVEDGDSVLLARKAQGGELFWVVIDFLEDEPIDVGGGRDADLTAIAGLTGTGFSARTADDTWALRTITGSTNVTVANGAGVAGNPTLSLPSVLSLASGGGISGSGYLQLASGAANDQILFLGSSAERARFNTTGDFVLGPTNKLGWSAAVGTGTIDTNLYRSAADLLRTDDWFQAPRIGINSTPIDGAFLYGGGFINDVTGTTVYGGLLNPTFRPTNDVAKSSYGLYAFDSVDSSLATGNLTASHYALRGHARHANGTRTVAGLISVYATGDISTGAGPVTSAYGLYVVNGPYAAAVGNYFGARIGAPTLAAGGSLGTVYGLLIDSYAGLGQSGNAYAMYVSGGNSRLEGPLGLGMLPALGRLQFVAGTTAADGIYFGSDTTLYRSAADVLKTDDTFESAVRVITPALRVTTAPVSGYVLASDVSGNAAWAPGGSSYTLSRGLQLVTNGNGLLGTNYNFTGFTFDAVETHGGAGSFRVNVAQQAKFSDELIPIDPESAYRVIGWAKSGETSGANFNAANKQYFGIAQLDIDGLAATPANNQRVVGSTDTTLAVALNPGDPTITLTDGTGWYNGATAAARHIAWWPYTNAKGYTWPDYTYTRNVSASDTWIQGAVSGNVITLKVPWAGAALPAGTKVRNAADGGSSGYKYIAAANVTIPNTWTRYEGYLSGLDTTYNGDTTKFQVGTAYLRLLFLVNYHGVADNNVRWSDLALTDLSARNLETTAVLPGSLTVPTTLDVTGAATFASNVNIRGTTLFRPLGQSNPLMQINNSGAANPGYISWYGTTGLRKAYLGYGTDSMVDLVMENAAHLNVGVAAGMTSLLAEKSVAIFSEGAKTFASSPPNQRSYFFTTPVAYQGDATPRQITNAATVAIGGAPSAGTNMTITNAYALWVIGGTSRFDGNLEVGNAIKPTLALPRLRIQGANAGSGVTEMWDRLSLSAGHAFGAFPDPGAGGLYLNGALVIQDTNLYRASADVLKTDDAFEAASMKSGGQTVVTTNDPRLVSDPRLATSGSRAFAMAVS